MNCLKSEVRWLKLLSLLFQLLISGVCLLMYLHRQHESMKKTIRETDAFRIFVFGMSTPEKS